MVILSLFSFALGSMFGFIMSCLVIASHDDDQEVEVEKLCSICGKNPHDPKCPNADQPIIGRCSWCDCEIYDYESYFTDNDGDMYCSLRCAAEGNGIKEVTEEEE